jgi:hypothetical protein
MSGDLYWEWLKVPPGARPPNHFELLGLPVDVEDSALIDQAARRQAKRIKEQQSGPNTDRCAPMMKEITLARATLLDPAQRAAYRATLNRKPIVSPRNDVASPATPTIPTTDIVAPADPFLVDDPNAGDEGIIQLRGRRRRTKSGSRMGLFVVASVVVVALIGVGIGAAVLMDTPAAKTEHVDSRPAVTHVVEKPKPAPTQRREPVSTVSPFVVESEISSSDPSRGAEPTSYERHTGLVQSLAVSPLGKRLLSAGVGGVIEWDLASGKSFLRTGFNGSAVGAVYLTSGKQIACADEGSIQIMDVRSNEVKTTLKQPRGNIRCIATDADGSHVYSAGTDGIVRRWNITTGKVMQDLEAGELVQIASLAVSRDSRLIAAGGSDGSASVWDLENGKRLWQAKNHLSVVAGVAFSPDGQLLATAGIDGSIGLWRSQDGSKIAKFPAHQDGAFAVAFLGGGAGIVSGGGDKTVKFWRLDSPHSLRTVNVPAAVQTIVTMLDGKSVLAAGGAGMLRRTRLPELDLDPIAKLDAPMPKLPMPSPAEVEKEVASITSKTRQQADGLSADELQGLAERWLGRAQAKAEPALRLAYFRRAIDLFAKLGKLTATFDAIQVLDNWFEDDALAEKAHGMTLLASVVSGPDQTELIGRGLKLLQQADAEDCLDVGDLVIEVFTKSLKNETPKDVRIASRVEKARAHHQQRAREVARLEECEAKLKTDPNDRDANLGSGMILCSRERWNEGLTRIAKGTDSTLATLAKEDLANPKDGKAQSSLGRGWADAANKLPDSKMVCLLRAKHWCELAQASLMGEEKSRVVLKLGEISAQLSSLRTDDFDLPPTPEKATGKPKSIARRNYNTISSKTVARSQWSMTNETRWDAAGLHFPAGEARLDSTFSLSDSWRIELVFEQDGRGAKIEVNNQSINIEAATGTTAITIERKGGQLLYTVSRPPKPAGAPTTIELTEINRAPSRLAIRLTGKSKGAEAMVLRAAVLNATVKVEE